MEENVCFALHYTHDRTFLNFRASRLVDLQIVCNAIVFLVSEQLSNVESGC